MGGKEKEVFKTGGLDYIPLNWASGRVPRNSLGETRFVFNIFSHYLSVFPYIYFEILILSRPFIKLYKSHCRDINRYNFYVFSCLMRLPSMTITTAITNINTISNDTAMILPMITLITLTVNTTITVGVDEIWVITTTRKHQEPNKY